MKQKILFIIMLGSLFLVSTAKAQSVGLEKTTETIKRVETIEIQQGLSAEHVADKTVTHGYSLIDAYIKELPEPTASFPNGYFAFSLDNGVRVIISPAGIGLNGVLMVWRSIAFSEPNDFTRSIILDGPISSGQPGILNKEAVADAKNVLVDYLSQAKMLVKEINKEDVNLNLSLTDDFQIFIDKMFDSISIPKPLQKTEEVEIIKDDSVISTIDLGQTIETEISTKAGVSRVSFEKVSQDSVAIKTGEASAITSNKITIKESKLYLETSAGDKQVNILPEQASLKAKEASNIVEVKEIKLKEESATPIYSVKGTKKAKLFSLIPINLKIKTKISAETGEVISVKKPWWSFLVF